MSYKKKVLFLLGFTVLLFLSSGFLYEIYHRKIGEFLQFAGLLSITAFVLLLIIYFLPESVFHAWKRFVLWFIPISTLLAILSPKSSSSGFGALSLGLDKELTTWFVTGLFFIISVILIITKAASAHDSKQSQNHTPPNQSLK